MVVELAYEYLVDGEPYTGSHTQPFLGAGSARSQLDQCQPGSGLIVRVRPRIPESSFVFVRYQDLYFHAHGFRLGS